MSHRDDCLLFDLFDLRENRRDDCLQVDCLHNLAFDSVIDGLRPSAESRYGSVEGLRERGESERVHRI